MLLGDSNVGKTSILLRYVDYKFNLNYKATLGVDFKVKNIDVDNIETRLYIYDTAG